MKITITKEFDQKTAALFLGLFEEETDYYAALSKELAQEIREALQRKAFSKKFGELLSTKVSALPYKKVFVLGLGKKKEFTVEKMRQALGKMVTAAKCNQYLSFSTNGVELASAAGKLAPEPLGRAVAESLFLANYNFNKYFAKEKQEKNPSLQAVSIQWKAVPTAFSAGLHTGQVIAESTNLVRDWVNEPSNIVNSEYLERAAKELAAAYPALTIKVLNKPELQQEKMEALLGVNAGSKNPPKLLVLEYRGSKKGKYTALVGKGITFDSGGYNLKPTKYIEDMKIDMAGAAAVMATLKVAAELQLKKNLVAVTPLCENMVDSTAQRPGDIVRACNGKTIEIGNTDAEGRLVLADALAYAEKKYQPEIIIDLATLTGACVVALGYYAAGLVGKDEKLLQELKDAGMSSGDRVWPLPFFDEYQDWMDGTITDLNNNGQKGKGYEAGSITGAVFLSKFVEKARWAHVDIAGSAYWILDGSYFSKGATGSGVRFLSYYLLEHQEKE